MTIDQRERRRRVGFADSADGCGLGGGWEGEEIFWHNCVCVFSFVFNFCPFICVYRVEEFDS